MGDHVGRLKIEDRLGERGRQPLAQFADVLCRRRMSLLEGDQDHAVIGVDGRSIGECEIICPLRYPDIVDDEIAIPFGNDLPDLVLDRLEQALGRLDTSGGRCADVQLDLPSVDGRKEVAPDQHQHRSGEREYQEADGRDRKPVFEQCSKQSGIALAHLLEGALKGTVEAREPVCRSVIRRSMMLALLRVTSGGPTLARSDLWSWRDIGSVLGRSRSAVHERFAKEEVKRRERG